jgi:hypothetical protein
MHGTPPARPRPVSLLVIFLTCGLLAGGCGDGQVKAKRFIETLGEQSSLLYKEMTKLGEMVGKAATENPPSMGPIQDQAFRIEKLLRDAKEASQKTPIPDHASAKEMMRLHLLALDSVLKHFREDFSKIRQAVSNPYAKPKEKIDRVVKLLDEWNDPTTTAKFKEAQARLAADFKLRLK